VGLASLLNILFYDQYRISQIQAGNYATLCVIDGSFIRPVGGYLADRIGGIQMLFFLYIGVATVMGTMSLIPSLGWGTVLLFLGMGLLGMGNGAVFQLVPQRFPREIGVMTGLVGAAGGLGGFILPNVLGVLRGMTGSFSGGFLVFAMAGYLCAALPATISSSWEQGFVGRGGLAAEST
jgi:MFS transporter, NNP family, nitrate/nitrite transporter